MLLDRENSFTEAFGGSGGRAQSLAGLTGTIIAHNVIAATAGGRLYATVAAPFAGPSSLSLRLEGALVTRHVIAGDPNSVFAAGGVTLLQAGPFAAAELQPPFILVDERVPLGAVPIGWLRLAFVLTGPAFAAGSVDAGLAMAPLATHSQPLSARHWRAL